MTARALNAPYSYTNQWSLQNCRECGAWLPSMDLGLESANHRPWRPGYLDFGTTRMAVEAAMARVTDDDFHASIDRGQTAEARS